MNCYETTEALALFASGDLDAQTASAIEAHVKECASCAAALAQTRAVTALARDALASIEPGTGFADAVMSAVGDGRPGDATRNVDVSNHPPAPRVVARRRPFAVAFASVLAVAAVALVVAILRPATAGRVASGDLGGETEVVTGRAYTAASEALLELVGGVKAFVEEGARFSLGAHELELLEGSCIVAAASAREGEVTNVRVGPALVVRFGRADVYVDAGAPVREVGVLDWLLPIAYAAEDDMCLVVAMAGDVEIAVAESVVNLRQGQAAFASLSPGAENVEAPVDIAAFISETETRLAHLDADTETRAALVAKYRGTIDSYTSDLAAKRERLAALAGDDDAGREELATRIGLVEELERVHTARLDQLTRPTDDGAREELTRRLENILAAQDAYGRLLRLLGPAEPVSNGGDDEQIEDEGKVSR